MKSSYIVILILVSVFSLSANDQLKEVKVNIDQLNNRQILKINAEPLVSQQTNFVWVESNWIYYTRERFSYRSDGSLDQEYEDSWQFSSWEDYRRWSYQYGQTDLLENIFGETKNFNQWDSLEWKTHSYGVDDNLQELIRYVYTYPGWYPTQRELYDYDSNGFVSKLIFQQPVSETDWYYTDLIQTNYKTNGQVSELYSFTSNSGDTTWNLSYKLEYVYDQNDVEEQEIFSIWNNIDSSWTPSSRTVNTIEDRQIIAKLYQSNYGSGWIDTGRDLYEYNPDGTLLNSVSQTGGGSDWENTRMKTFEYYPASDIKPVAGRLVSSDYHLFDNYPNPFNPETTIKFSLPKAGYVNLQVYNILGKSVATLVDKNIVAGEYTVKFNGTDLPSGPYFYRLQTAEFKMTKKFMLIK